MFGGGARLGERGWGADAHAAEAALCVVRGIDQRPLALILTLSDPNPDPNSIVLQQYSPAGATKAIKQHGHLTQVRVQGVYKGHPATSAPSWGTSKLPLVNCGALGKFSGI